MVKDGRGNYSTQLKLKNRERVRRWVRDNPNGTISDCQKELKLSYPAVRRALDYLKSEE